MKTVLKTDTVRKLAQGASLPLSPGRQDSWRRMDSPSALGAPPPAPSALRPGLRRMETPRLAEGTAGS